MRFIPLCRVTSGGQILKSSLGTCSMKFKKYKVNEHVVS